ncbi:MAG: lipid-A-disaccharide synthase [Terracidiphilus sp.]|jgi:lipid A disaccharide synthetase
MSTTIFISAGEASGEHYGALLVAALKQQLAAAGQTAEFFGMGGTRMEAAGLERVVHAEEMAVMGLTEVVRHLPRIYREFRKLKKAIRERRPSVAVLIDFPEIHFRLAKELHRLGVPVIFFVSPQLWAWKKHRIKLVQKYIREMLVIFPFEEPFYREHGIQAEFVGHPLAELPLPAIGREQFAAENKLDPAKTWIGLLPGSRPKEIRDHLPVILQAAREIEQSAEKTVELEGNPVSGAKQAAEKGRIAGESAEEHPSGAKARVDLIAFMARLKSCPVTKREDFGMRASFSATSKAHRSLSAPYGTTEVVPCYKAQPGEPFSATSKAQAALADPDARVQAPAYQFVVPLAPTLNAAQRAEVRNLVEAHGAGLAVRLVEDARAALFHARASVVASGTATVEAALIGNPFVVVYRVSPLTYAIAKRVVKVPFVAMANLIAGKLAVPELIQDDFTAANIVQQIGKLLPDGAARQSMIQELAAIRSELTTRPAGQGEAGGAIDRVAEITLETMRQDG